MAPPLLAVPIITAVGRFAAPYLSKELSKLGLNKFVSTYGKEAFTSLNETLAADTPMLKADSVPMVNPNFASTDSDDDDPNLPMVKDQNQSNQPQQEPPEDKGPNLGTEVATEAALEISKNLSKQEDIKSQTEKALEPKVEFGPLTSREKQTALALMGDQPEFYSRVVKSITDAKPNKLTKNKWKSFIQADKNEIKYLGLDKLLQGNESITKQELLDFVQEKNLAPYINVTTGTYEDIATEGMAGIYKDYSLGFGKDEEFTSFQIDKSFFNNENMFQSQHGNTEYGSNMFGHARTQVGVGEPDSPPADFGSRGKEITGKLKNTLIIDEIQSDWLQKANKSGFESEWTIIKGDKITEEFLKNYENEYEIESNKGDMPVNLVATLYSKDTEGSLIPTQTISKNQYYVFDKEGIHLGQNFQADTLEQAQREVIKESAPDFPIIESKKWVELILNEMIKKAVYDGRDSIAITNGQIQFDRYDGMDREDAEGLKKFYDDIVAPQLEKIAKNYNVKTEKISIENPEENVYDQDLMGINTRMKEAMDAGYTLKKIEGGLLQNTMSDEPDQVPDFFSIYSNSGKAQGSTNIFNVIDQDNTGRIEDEARNNEYFRHPKDYYVWVLKDSKLEKAIDDHNSGKEDYINLSHVFFRTEDRPTAFGTTKRTSVKFDMPISVVDEDIEPEATIPAGTGPDDLADAETVRVSVGDIPDNTNYSAFLMNQYIKNRKDSENYDLKYEEDQQTIIKMELPKKLQKDILSKPIKLSKVKQQTDRLFA